MFVYIGLDNENRAFKVGITKSTVKERLAGHNHSQDNFYFEEYFSKEFVSVCIEVINCIGSNESLF